MEVFKKIFNFSKEQMNSEIERRKNTRYEPGSAYPIQVNLEDQEKSHECKLIDVSFGGMRLKTKKYSLFKKGDIIKMKVTLEKDINYNLKVKIAHISNDELGLEILQESYLNINNYFQSILPIYVGQSFVEYNNEKKVSDEKKISEKYFYGYNSSSLIFWYTNSFHKNPDQTIEFEFKMDGYVVRGQTENFIINVYSIKENDQDHKYDKMSTVLDKQLDPKKTQEVLKFFYWVILNSKGNLPDYLISYLEKYF